MRRPNSRYKGADLCKNPNKQDHHAWGWAQWHYWECQSQKTRRASHLISRVWFSLANSQRMATICQTTISKKSPPYTWCFGCEMTSSSRLSTSLLRNTTGTRWSATSVILTYIPALSTATNAAKSTTCTPRRSNKAPSPTSPWLSKWPPAQGPWPLSLNKASLSWKKKKKERNQLQDLMSTWASILMRSQVMFVKIKYRRFYMKKENT